MKFTFDLSILKPRGDETESDSELVNFLDKPPPATSTEAKKFEANREKILKQLDLFDDVPPPIAVSRAKLFVRNNPRPDGSR